VHLLVDRAFPSPPPAWWPSCWEFIVIDLVSALVQLPAVLPMDIDISPNDSGLPGISQLRTIVGAVMTIGLILSVLALIISAIVWGFGSNSSNPHLAGRGKIGVLVSCGAAVICGAAVTLINFFWNVGQQV
jgi:ABC-type sulfate transport system permease component